MMDRVSTSPVMSRGSCSDDEPLLLRAEDAARLLSLGRSKVFQLMAADELPGVVRIGRSIRISRRALEAWVEAQERADESTESR